MELRFRSRISYKLNAFSYCRILNDTIKSASVMRNSPNMGNYNQFNANKFIGNFSIIPRTPEILINTPCHTPILAIRKWKHWLPVKIKCANKKLCFNN